MSCIKNDWLVSLDVLGGAQDGPAQSCGLIRCSVKVVKDHFLQIGLHFLHLSEDDAALPLDFRLTQRAVLDDVGQNLHSLGKRYMKYFMWLMCDFFSQDDFFVAALHSGTYHMK